MKIVCIKEIKSTEPVFNSIRLGSILEVSKESNYKGGTLSGFFYLLKGSIEYALPMENFITMEEWRDQQLNKILDE